MRKLGMFVLGFAAIAFAGSLAQAAHEEEDMGEPKKFSIHGEVRFRGEWFTNLTDFTDTGTADPLNVGANGDDDTHDIFPWRVRFGAKGDLGNDILVYGEFQGSGVAGATSAGGGDEQTRSYFGDQIDPGNDVDLYQGFIRWQDIGSSTIDLTIGRQEIVFDRGLHFSALDYYNGISHDGIMASWDSEGFCIHGFWTRVDEDQSGLDSFIDQSDDDLLGFHFKWLMGDDDTMDVAAYLFYEIDRFSGIGNSAIYTLGGRWGKEIEDDNGLFWNAELAIQTGDAADVPSPGMSFDQSSHIFEGHLGWAFADAQHKVWLGALIASGDDDPLDDEIGTYNPLYADFHNRLGYADIFDLANITSFNVGWKYTGEEHGFGAAYYIFSKTEDEDFVYSSPIHFFEYPSVSMLPCSGSGCEDDLGSELDIFYKYRPTGNFGFDVAWSIYMPGDAMEVNVGSLAVPDVIGEDTAWRLTAQARARW